MLIALLAGFGLCLSLIVAPGAQNVFLLREGIRHATSSRRHAVVLALVCFACDIVLISAGVAGFGAAVEAMPWLFDAARWAGVTFLAGYGLFAAWRAVRGEGEAIDATDGSTHSTGRRSDGTGGVHPDGVQHSDGAPTASGSTATATLTAVGTRTSPKHVLLPAVLTCLAITWLNPHTYLDTVLMLGSISTAYGDAAWLFGLGAIAGSAVWFAFLTFAARFAARWLRSPRSWRVLDAIIAVTMLGLASALALG
ncbi:LysE/ArgO family amino acid transporter [Microbacterium halotolerans]|uniref:LysE/ArgO family amino acid transporter n=1 Tax=Microbacterium halotolerans TaxID=246613 RepID=UPI000E6AAD2F|nr:LysE family transporter [Microbacterium halotolerans]